MKKKVKKEYTFKRGVFIGSAIADIALRHSIGDPEIIKETFYEDGTNSVTITITYDLDKFDKCVAESKITNNPPNT